jgi:hypothetical protein
MNKDKVFLDRNNIINWIPENPTGDIEGTILSFDVMRELLNECGPTSVLVDLSKAIRPDASQRKIMIERIKDDLGNIKKGAIFGNTPLMKAVAYFVINATGIKNIKFFDSRNQAMTWLRQE